MVTALEFGSLSRRREISGAVDGDVSLVPGVDDCLPTGASTQVGGERQVYVALGGVGLLLFEPR